jgi:antitoxin FitA
MAKMIQVRNVPEKLHRELIKRARRRGQTLTDYIQELLEREVSRPSAEELFDRIASRSSVDLGGPASDLIRAERAARRVS